MFLNHCTVKLIYWIIVVVSTVGKDQYFLCYDSTTSHDYTSQSWKCKYKYCITVLFPGFQIFKVSVLYLGVRNGEKKVCQCLVFETLQPSAWIFLFNILASVLRKLHQPQNVSFWRPGNDTQQSAIFLVRLGTARTNPTDSHLYLAQKFRGILFTF